MVAPVGLLTTLPLAVFLLFYVPLVSLLLLHRLQIFAGAARLTRHLVQAGLGVGLAVLTLLIIRAASYASLDWLALYCLVATVACGLLWLRARPR